MDEMFMDIPFILELHFHKPNVLSPCPIVGADYQLPTADNGIYVAALGVKYAA